VDFTTEQKGPSYSLYQSHNGKTRTRRRARLSGIAEKPPVEGKKDQEALHLLSSSTLSFRGSADWAATSMRRNKPTSLSL